MNEKQERWYSVFGWIDELKEDLMILRQADVTAGEKKAIGAMIAKLDKFKTYGINCLQAKGGER